MNIPQHWRRLKPNLFSASQQREEVIHYPSEGLEEDPAGLQSSWVRYRNFAILDFVTSHDLNEIVEVGAGNGVVAQFLTNQGINVVAIEPHILGAEQIAHHGIRTFVGTLHDADFPAKSVSSIGMFDVIEHIQDPSVILNECHRVMSHESRLIITVPVGKWLWGAIDDLLGHQTRYRKTTLNAILRECGFKVIHSRYLFLSLVPIAVLTRVIPYRLTRNRVSMERHRKQVMPGRYLDWTLGVCLGFEKSLSRILKLPYGLSLIVIAEKVECS